MVIFVSIVDAILSRPNHLHKHSCFINRNMAQY